MTWAGFIFKSGFIIVIVLIALVGVVGAIDETGSRGSVAFVSDRDGNREIYLMDLDRQFTRRLTHHPGMDMNPAWSPDGRQIAFYANRDGPWNLYIMQASGLHVRRITNHEGP